MTSVVDVLKTIADDKSLVLFNTIAGDNDIFIGILGLTRKQYYSRLSAFLKAGLVKRERRKYSLSTFGIIVYHTQEIIGKAVNQYWKLRAIDSIGVSGNGEMPQEQFHIIIDKLIDNQEIKNILLKQVKVRSSISELLQLDQRYRVCNSKRTEEALG